MSARPKDCVSTKGQRVCVYQFMFIAASVSLRLLQRVYALLLLVCLLGTPSFLPSKSVFELSVESLSCIWLLLWFS